MGGGSEASAVGVFLNARGRGQTSDRGVSRPGPVPVNAAGVSTRSTAAVSRVPTTMDHRRGVAAITAAAAAVTVITIFSQTSPGTQKNNRDRLSTPAPLETVGDPKLI